MAKVPEFSGMVVDFNARFRMSISLSEGKRVSDPLAEFTDKERCESSEGLEDIAQPLIPRLLQKWLPSSPQARHSCGVT